MHFVPIFCCIFAPEFKRTKAMKHCLRNIVGMRRVQLLCPANPHFIVHVHWFSGFI